MTEKVGRKRRPEGKVFSVVLLCKVRFVSSGTDECVGYMSPRGIISTYSDPVGSYCGKTRTDNHASKLRTRADDYRPTALVSCRILLNTPYFVSNVCGEVHDNRTPQSSRADGVDGRICGVESVESEWWTFVFVPSGRMGKRPVIPDTTIGACVF